MLQSLRDNLKGGVAVFVSVIFVVPMILFGVEQLFVGSVTGNDVAEVNGQGIPARELERAIFAEKQRLAQQFGLDVNSDQLDDSLLREPVLQRLIQRQALLQAAREAGMGAPKDVLWRDIAATPAFQRDGKFDAQLFKDRIAGSFTPATYLEAVGEDYLLAQLQAGVEGTAFATSAELALVAAITGQKRSFYNLLVAAPDPTSFEISEADIEAYYEAERSQFEIPEQITVDYLELTVEQLAETLTPTQAEIEAAYQQELEDYQALPALTVAHILIESGGDATERVAAVQQGLAGGADFAELAQQYSDDLGSKDNGGALGQLVPEAFPQEFVEAANRLAEGEVSPPVKTEAGTHFIKVIEKADVSPPTLAEREPALRRQLALAMAQEEFAARVADLDELTFGDVELGPVGERLGIPLRTSEPFIRGGGAGIANEEAVVRAAFSDEVLTQGYNSKVIELAGGRAVVLSLRDRTPASVRPLAEVREQIVTTLQAERAEQASTELAEQVADQLRAGQATAEVAEAHGLEVNTYENVERTDSQAPPSVMQTVFSLPRPQGTQPVIEVAAMPGNGRAVIGLLEVTDGTMESLEEDQRAAIARQLAAQQGQADLAAFESMVLEKAKVATR